MGNSYNSDCRVFAEERNRGYMNRSNPLPIHQFPNLINEVARLKELAIRAKKVERINEEKNIRSVDTEYAVKSYLASFDMLAVLSGFQKGDARRFDSFFRDCMCPDSEHPPECCMCSENTNEFCDLLRRYRGMAQAMEATR